MTVKATFLFCLLAAWALLALVFVEADRFSRVPLPSHATIMFREGRVVDFDRGAEWITGMRRTLAIGRHTGDFLLNPEVEFAGSPDHFRRSLLTIKRSDGSVLETPAILHWSQNAPDQSRTFSIRVDIDAKSENENGS